MAHPEASLGMKIIELIKLININLNHFPKHEKYGLCQKIRQAVYDVFEMSVECQKRYHKKTTLTTLDIRHEQLRMLLRVRFVRRFSVHNFSKALKQHKTQSIVSLLGNARHSGTYAYFKKQLQEMAA